MVPVWRSMYEAMQPAEPVDAVPDYLPPNESPQSNPELAKRYPLNILQLWDKRGLTPIIWSR